MRKRAGQALVYLGSEPAEEDVVRLSDDDIARLVGDLDALPQPLQSHVQELIDNPQAFERRAAAVEIAISFYNATLLAVLDEDLRRPQAPMPPHSRRAPVGSRPSRSV